MGRLRHGRASRASTPATSSPPTTCRACSAPGTTRWPPQRTKELDLRIGRAGVASPTEADYKAAARLGTPYKVYENDVSAVPGRGRQAPRGRQRGRRAAGDWPVPPRSGPGSAPRSAAEFFRAEHGREPADARELAATIAKHSRPKTNAVAGYDLTFSPVKSVSTLWAVADPKTAAVIERAHQAAIKDALDFIETKALFTRQGTNGVRQVDVRGLVATAFTHRDSRAGDPDLHTHVAVANKVQTLDGQVAGHRRPGAVQGQVVRLGDLQHRARAAPGRRARACGSRSARTPTPASGRCARSSASTPT